MKLAKVIRQSLKGDDGKTLKPWVMFQRMEKKSVQAYLSLERSAKKISLSDLVKLKEVSGLSLHEFWALIERCAKDEK